MARVPPTYTPTGYPPVQRQTEEPEQVLSGRVYAAQVVIASMANNVIAGNGIKARTFFDTDTSHSFVSRCRM